MGTKGLEDHTLVLYMKLYHAPVRFLLTYWLRKKEKILRRCDA